LIGGIGKRLASVLEMIGNRFENKTTRSSFRAYYSILLKKYFRNILIYRDNSKLIVNLQIRFSFKFPDKVAIEIINFIFIKGSIVNSDDFSQVL